MSTSCQHCGVTFELTRADGKFCSRQCCVKFHRVRDKMDPAKRAKAKERWARYGANHREQVAAKTKRWREANPERSAATIATYRQENPDWYREYTRANARTRYARLKGVASVAFTAEQLESRLAYWGHACWMCGDIATQVDHVKPISRGGPHMLSNLRPACRRCNIRKSAKWHGPQNLVAFVAEIHHPRVHMKEVGP